MNEKQFHIWSYQITIFSPRMNADCADFSIFQRIPYGSKNDLDILRVLRLGAFI